MTARLIYEATLIELSKVLAPSLKLYEFNYLFNKAINQYINKVYNIYDVNLQTTDDLRVLKATAHLVPSISDNATDATYNNTSKTSKSKYNLANLQSLNGATYEVELPQDYLHLLNCICIYYVNKQKDCWDAGTFIQIPATRLTADSWSLIITDIYNRPSPMKPYYYIHNQNQKATLPTNEYDSTTGYGTDFEGDYEVTSVMSSDGSTADTSQNANSNLPRTFKVNNTNRSLVEKPIATRISNATRVTLEIRYGKDNTVFELAEVWVDYVKSPQFIRLTQELIDMTEDTSQMMEFPDYVNQEIINELVHLVMERTTDPRLQTNMQISLSIARPTQQLQQPAQAAE